MVTIKDIAERLGISISTVSKGLHGASDISEEMRQQVLDTAIEMGYIIKEKKPATRQKVCIIVEIWNTRISTSSVMSLSPVSGL